MTSMDTWISRKINHKSEQMQSETPRIEETNVKETRHPRDLMS